MTTKRLIVALSSVSTMLLMALVCLVWPAWSMSQLPATTFIVGKWYGPATDTLRWTDYVEGALAFGAYLSLLLVYKQTSWRQIATFFGAGFVLGAMSWLVGTFVVSVALWLALITFYALYRFSEPDRLFDRQSLESIASLFLAAGFAAGLKYGLGGAGTMVVAMSFGAFIGPIGFGEVLYLIGTIKDDSGPQVGQLSLPL